jgi:hypothetical protein
MKSLLTAVAVSLAVSSAAAYNAQEPAPTTPPPAPPAVQTPTQTPAPSMGQTSPAASRNDVTVTGCLVQGSGPSVFLIKDAKKDAKSTAEKGVSYVVVTTAENVNLRAHLNHEITISGESDGRLAPASTEKANENELPKLTAKNVTMISATCATTGSPR